MLKCIYPDDSTGWVVASKLVYFKSGELSDDRPMKWAIEREAQLRHDSYRQAMLWEKGVEEALRLQSAPRRCNGGIWPDNVGAWLAWRKEQMREAYDADDPKHPDWHSVRADLYDAREGK